MARLVDTNVLVYRFDSLDPVKQRRASALLGKGITDGSLRVAHQSILEFVAAVTRPRKVLDGRALLTQTEANAAIDVARTTSGVRKVVNLIEIITPAKARELDLSQQSSNKAPVENKNP